MTRPTISFIVSHYHRPMHLRCLLASLALQAPGWSEILVTDNSMEPAYKTECSAICREFGAAWIPTGKTCKHCYESADAGAKIAGGEWLCFPCEDNYYVPGFTKVMLEAARRNAWSFVYCDCLYDPRLHGTYGVLDAQPVLGRMDKGNFIVRRELFEGFPPHELEWRDGALAVSLVERGVRHGKAPGILCVHN